MFPTIFFGIPTEIDFTVYYACVMNDNLVAPNPEPQSVRMFMSLISHPWPFWVQFGAPCE